MKNFDEIYENVCKKYAKPMEEKRKSARNGMVVVFLLAMALGIILTVITGYKIFLMIGLMAFILYVAMSKNNKEYKKFFKENIIKEFIKEYSETLDYLPEQGLTEFVYDEAEFEKHYDRYHSEDFITGTLNDKYRISMAEVHTEDETTDSDGDRSYRTIFYGLFAKIEFEKEIDAVVKIRKNVLLSSKRDKIEMDSREFEKKFDVYTSNQIISMQLLTADIMQMLIEFIEENKVTPEITLKGNRLYIRFATGDVFEPYLIGNSMEYSTLKKYYDTINFTLDITEKFLKNIEETEV